MFVIHIMYQEFTNKLSNSGIKRILETHTSFKPLPMFIEEQVELKDNTLNKSVCHLMCQMIQSLNIKQVALNVNVEANIYLVS